MNQDVHFGLAATAAERTQPGDVDARFAEHVADPGQLPGSSSR
ncbi:hypothetical protein I553_9919 [Mycobacterium xenopi 4042]|uniref:Uncharacterized protein n=1 Tax=Mycobacterium xenopi 4042 TaxID=1299334 RepID=X7YNU5_MYCXE|nr:hypothetical protein I553_9919 [Mycobacterium xenopi 4042]